MAAKPEAKNPAEDPNKNLPMVIDYGDDAGAGMEDLRPEELKVPMIRSLHQNAPQCQPVEAGGIEGAKPGMIFNTATREMWDGKEGVLFVPVKRDYNFVEYVPRDEGGGFVGIHAPETDLVVSLREQQGKFKRLKSANGTEIIETFYLFGLLITPDGMVEQVVQPWTSTQIGKYRNFIAQYTNIKYPDGSGRMITPPLYAHKWRLKTTFQKNDKGTWYGWDLSLAAATPLASRMRLDDQVYQMGKGFYEMLKSGLAKADHEKDAKAGGEGADDAPF